MREAATLLGIHEPTILAIDNGGTRTRMTHDFREIKAWDTPKDYQEAVAKIALQAEILLEGRRPDAIGISIAGKVSNGAIVEAGQLQEYGWLNLPFATNVAHALKTDAVVLLNDCVAGANAERVARKPTRDTFGAFMVLSTGFGGAIYTHDSTISDEPGHHFLRDGAICGDGENGHMEAYISGSGIARRFNLPDEQTRGLAYLPHGDERWELVRRDLHESMEITLHRYKEELGDYVDIIGFTGAVALGGPDLLGGMQRHLSAGMGNNAPRIMLAKYGEESGLRGVRAAAHDFIQAA